MDKDKLQLCKFVPADGRFVIEVSQAPGVLSEISRSRSPQMRVEVTPPSQIDISGQVDTVLIHEDAVGSITKADFAAMLARVRKGGQCIASAQAHRLFTMLPESGFRVFQTEGVLRAVKQDEPVQGMLLHCSIPNEEEANATIRIHYPNAFMRTVPGIRPYAQTGFLTLGAAAEGEMKIMIFNRSVPRLDRDLDMLRRVIEAGYVMVYEIDDHPSHYPKYFDDNGFALRCYHAVQTTNDRLADIFRPEFGTDIALFPNQLAFLPARREADDAPIRVFFGAYNRSGEGREILRSINSVLSSFGDSLCFEVVYDRGFFDGLETPHKKFTPRCAYDRYQQILGSCDIALLPLGGTAFNRCKSDLKFLECAGHGVAAICSPTVYAGSVEHEKTGLIVDRLDAFGAALKLLVENVSLRQRLQDNAYSYVKDHRVLADHYRARVDWYRSLWERREALQERLRKRAPEIFER